MWYTIFAMNRIGEDDPVAAWQAHIADLKDRQGRLNAKAYRRLHYRAPGTDLSVELPEGHIWLGGAEQNAEGVWFVPNMPTEEVFTLPKRDGVNGTVRSTLPLNLSGRMIDGFSLTFQNGRVTSYTAEKGEEHLKQLLETDEGASHLGEVALVPYDSPISRLKRIFYNTGVDENASCHLAFGNAYPINLKGGRSMTKEQLLDAGANVSLTHVDFMIGSAELEIDGELPDGTIEPVFRGGNWA
jgi:aminopeptidase